MLKKKITTKKRKEINKSGSSPCQICKNVTFLQTHHIEGRNIPNANRASNLIDICANCHNEIHHGEIIIEGWFMSTGGMELIWHKKEENGLTGNDITPYIIGSQPTKKPSS